ncbi:MAG: prepilin-type N-terminal cleavage/methylation domain-containing protein [Verrucomicrobiales bacterium]|nr:prepilin-type N-terminal cleavage/methylation domain-containing protein [Verrucomicrobiales bacterium]
MRRNAGFSLVELMCAILILGIGLVGITQGITTALRSSKESELQTTAALIAAGRIELLRADGYLINGEEEGECGDGLRLYRWKQSITSSTIDGLHEVEIAIAHGKSGKVIYELRTLLFDPPLDSSLSGSATKSPMSRKKEARKR